VRIKRNQNRVIYPLRYTYSRSREIAQNDTFRKYCSLDMGALSFDYLGLRKLAGLR